jgi:hypothetical protein
MFPQKRVGESSIAIPTWQVLFSGNIALPFWGSSAQKHLEFIASNNKNSPHSFHYGERRGKLAVTYFDDSGCTKLPVKVTSTGKLRRYK